MKILSILMTYGKYVPAEGGFLDAIIGCLTIIFIVGFGSIVLQFINDLWER